MKKITVILLASIWLASCNTKDKNKDGELSREEIIKDSLRNIERQKAMADTANYTTIQWLDSSFINKGKVKEGDSVIVSYRFKNTGDRPLVVANVVASCGCTVPEKPEEPIAPGAEGVIKAKFDSQGRKGSNRKHITVDANTKPNRTHELEFQVDVE